MHSKTNHTHSDHCRLCVVNSHCTFMFLQRRAASWHCCHCYDVKVCVCGGQQVLTTLYVVISCCSCCCRSRLKSTIWWWWPELILKSQQANKQKLHVCDFSFFVSIYQMFVCSKYAYVNFLKMRGPIVKLLKKLKNKENSSSCNKLKNCFKSFERNIEYF